MAQEDLPADQATLERAVVAETIRQAIGKLSPSASEGVHILSIRAWVTRKLRGLIPSLADPAATADFFLEGLKDGYQNLAFLGDVIELEGGYYAAAPTRLVEIGAGRAALVSGQPTTALLAAGIPLKIVGVGRHVTEVERARQLGVETQRREDYIGRFGAIVFNEAYLRTTVLATSAQPSPGDWQCYQGHRGYDFTWGDHEHTVASSFGFASAWRARGGVDDERYQLRVTMQGETTGYVVPTRLFKHLCLLIDSMEGKQRIVRVGPEGQGMTLEMDFSPPEAHLRWLYATGATWLGFKAGNLRWGIPPESVQATVEVFQKLPVRVDRGAR